MNTAEQFHVDQVSPFYRRVTFDNGLQQPDGIETNLGIAIGKLRQNA